MPVVALIAPETTTSTRQGQDQVEASQCKDGNADQHPERVITIGRVDAVKSDTASLGNILRNFVIIKGIVADEPLPGKIMCIGQRRIKIDSHEYKNKRDLKGAGDYLVIKMGASQFVI